MWSSSGRYNLGCIIFYRWDHVNYCVIKIGWTMRQISWKHTLMRKQLRTVRWIYSQFNDNTSIFRNVYKFDKPGKTLNAYFEVLWIYVKSIIEWECLKYFVSHLVIRIVVTWYSELNMVDLSFPSPFVCCLFITNNIQWIHIAKSLQKYKHNVIKTLTIFLLIFFQFILP